jgi:hypothetical protein
VVIITATVVNGNSNEFVLLLIILIFSLNIKSLRTAQKFESLIQLFSTSTQRCQSQSINLEGQPMSSVSWYIKASFAKDCANNLVIEPALIIHPLSPSFPSRSLQYFQLDYLNSYHPHERSWFDKKLVTANFLSAHSCL